MQYVLISIHPEYAEKIFSGKKKIEFRKKAPKNEETCYVVYSTKPVGKIIGYFISNSIEKNTPEELWNKYKNCSGISPRKYYEYYKNVDVAVGILINNICRLRNEKEISFFNLNAPQSYQYIDEKVFQEISR